MVALNRRTWGVLFPPRRHKLAPKDMNNTKSGIAALLLTLAACSFIYAEPASPATSPPLTQEQTAQINQLIQPHLERAEAGSRWWSIAHNGCIFLSVILGAATALILKLDYFKGKAYQNDVAATCAALATLLTLLDTSGGFNRKWTANRATRVSLQQLQIDLFAPPSDDNARLAEATKRLKEIISAHNRTISGDADVPKTQPPVAPK